MKILETGLEHVHCSRTSFWLTIVEGISCSRKLMLIRKQRERSWTLYIPSSSIFRLFRAFFVFAKSGQHIHHPECAVNAETTSWEFHENSLSTTVKRCLGSKFGVDPTNWWKSRLYMSTSKVSEAITRLMATLGTRKHA